MTVMLKAVALAFAIICQYTHCLAQAADAEIQSCYEHSDYVDPADCIRRKDEAFGEILTQSYQRLLAITDVKKSIVRQQQRNWLKYQRSTCEQELHNFIQREGSGMISAAVEQGCLLRTTLERIKDLENQIAAHSRSRQSANK